MSTKVQILSKSGEVLASGVVNLNGKIVINQTAISPDAFTAMGLKVHQMAPQDFTCECWVNFFLLADGPATEIHKTLESAQKSALDNAGKFLWTAHVSKVVTKEV